MLRSLSSIEKEISETVPTELGPADAYRCALRLLDAELKALEELVWRPMDEVQTIGLRAERARLVKDIGILRALYARLQRLQP